MPSTNRFECQGWWFQCLNFGESNLQIFFKNKRPLIWATLFACVCVCWVIQKCQKMLLYLNPHLSNPALVKRWSTKIKVGLLLWVLLLIDSTVTPSIVFLTAFEKYMRIFKPVTWFTWEFHCQWWQGDERILVATGRFSFYFQERPFEPDELDYTQVWEIITEWTCSTSQT